MILFEQTTEASFVFHSDGRCPDRHMGQHPKLQTSECATLAVTHLLLGANVRLWHCLQNPSILYLLHRSATHAIPSFKSYLTYPTVIDEY